MAVIQHGSLLEQIPVFFITLIEQLKFDLLVQTLYL